MNIIVDTKRDGTKALKITAVSAAEKTALADMFMRDRVGVRKKMEVSYIPPDTVEIAYSKKIRT